MRVEAPTARGPGGSRTRTFTTILSLAMPLLVSSGWLVVALGVRAAIFSPGDIFRARHPKSRAMSFPPGSWRPGWYSTVHYSLCPTTGGTLRFGVRPIHRPLEPLLPLSKGCTVATGESVQ